MERKAEVRGFNYRRQYPKVVFPGKTQLDFSAQPYPAVPAGFHPFNPFLWPRQRAAIAEHAPDWLLAAWWTPLFAASLWRFLRGIPRGGRPRIALICHNICPHEPVPLTGYFQNRLFGIADRFVVHWKGDADLAEKGQPGKPVLSMFHPVYGDFIRPAALTRSEAKARLGVPEGREVVLFFGFVRPYKGLDTLCRAVLHLLETGRDAHLLVAGEFYERRSRYERLLDQLAGKGALTLHDSYIPNERIGEFFSAADVVALPYRHATQTGVVPLAYQRGRGVVVTDVGGLAEMVDDGRSGVVVAPGDPGALADGIRRFLGCQASVEDYVPCMASRFSIGRYADRLLDWLKAEPAPGVTSLGG